VAVERELDQLIDDLVICHTARNQHLGEHGDRREAGHRVDLVAQEATPVLLEEKVAARKPPTTQRTVHGQCYRVHIGHLLRRQRRRHEPDAGVVHILVVVAVELVAGDDLAGHRHERFVVADYRHLDLAPDDCLFHDDPFVVGERVLDRVAQTLDGLGLGDPDRRTHVGGLDETRKTELFSQLGGQAGAKLVLGERPVPRLRYAGRGEHLLRHRLVHRECRTEHAGADVRDVGELEHPLHRAVLAHRTVQQRQYDGALGTVGGVAEHRRWRQPVAVWIEPRRDRVRSACQGRDGVGCQRPLTVGRDADRRDAVPVRVDGRQHVGRRRATQVVLRRLSPEKHDEVDKVSAHYSDGTVPDLEDAGIAGREGCGRHPRRA